MAVNVAGRTVNLAAGAATGAVGMATGFATDAATGAVGMATGFATTAGGAVLDVGEGVFGVLGTSKNAVAHNLRVDPSVRPSVYSDDEDERKLPANTTGDGASGSWGFTGGGFPS